jgi:translation elongation factor P/translation initiation factor 5A
MILNYKIIPNRYKCNGNVAKFLIYKQNIPLLAVDGKDYYFADNESLRLSLKKIPISVKIKGIFCK